MVAFNEKTYANIDFVGFTNLLPFIQSAQPVGGETTADQ